MTEEVPSSSQSCAFGRYAPSPTGRMHLGNIFCALLAWLSVKREGGQFILRIEDLDTGRCRREFADLIMSDLEWLGLEWDRGPFYQSQRQELYSDALERLESKGMTYPCWCTRADLNAASAPHENDGMRVYPGTCRDNPARAAQFAGKPSAIRLRVRPGDVEFTDAHYGYQRVNLERECGDFVLRRSDGAWAYQLAVTVDDALMGVTQVVRGRDLLSSVAPQSYLMKLLGYGGAIEYGHIPLLCSSVGRRLCKRDRSLDMSVLREKHSKEEIIGYLGHLAGLVPAFTQCSAQDLLTLFDWQKIPREDIIIKQSL